MLTFSLVCHGQTKSTDGFLEINYKDVTEIKGLVYYKADTTLVSGKVVRYNKKNKAKSYVLVSNGKPDNHSWVQLKEEYQEPEKKMKTKRTVPVVNEAGITIGDIEEPVNKYYDQMSDRNDITNDIQSNMNSNALIKQDDSSYKKEVLNNDIIIDKVERNGIWEKHYSNEKLEVRGVYIKGKKDGLWEEYYENGQLKRKTIYIRGVKDGLWEQYHANGQLWGKGYYDNGLTIGEWKYYDKAGILILTENYDN